MTDLGRARVCAAVAIAAMLTIWTFVAPARGAMEPDARAALSAAREAVKKSKSLAYRAEYVSSREGAPSPEARLTAEVMLKRAVDDKGIGWKIYIGGESSRGGGAASRVYAVFDGVAARSMRESEQAIFERNTAERGALRSFFETQGGIEALAWEILEEEPFAGAIASSESSLEKKPVTIEGESCRVVTVKSVDGGLTRYFLATSDHLPRRVEMTAKPAESGGEGGKNAGETRTLTLREVKIDRAIAEGTFIMDVPDGYMVRAIRDQPVKPAGAGGEDGSGKTGGTGTKARTMTPGLLVPGSAAPAWTLKDAAGKDVSLSDFAGKVVVLDFWGSWCPPCRAAMPSVEKIHQKYKDKGVVVIGLNYERRPDADPAKFMRDNGFTYRLVRGAETIAGDYKVPGWPTFYVVDTKGKIVWGSVGFDKSHAEQHERDMSDAIEESLEGGL
jgi:thiol-disulfide isomerase/thioredoxin